MSGKPVLRVPLGADVVSLVLAGSLPLSTRDGGATGARLLLTLSRPKFMMLAGVTGVMRTSSGAGKAVVVAGVQVGGEDGRLGGAGGGMARSTGDGESVSMAELFRRARVERKSGVEVADLTFRAALIDGTIGVVRFRGTRAASSPEGEAVRLAGLLLGGCGWASSHGLVSGEMSRSDGEGKD